MTQPDDRILDANGKALTFTVEQVQRVVKNVWSRFSDSEGSTRAKGIYPVRMHSKIEWQRQHYYNLPEADPPLGQQWPDATPYQSDILRDTAWKLEARLLENRYQFELTAPPGPSGEPTSPMQKAAEDTEQWLQVGFEMAQERQRVDIQKGLVQLAVRKCYGIFHWRTAYALWPEMPDLEYLEDVPEGAEGKGSKRTANGREYRHLRANPKGKWGETEDSLKRRDSFAKAQVGFPIVMEIIDPARFAYVKDITCSNGLGAVVVCKVIELIDYNAELAKQNQVLESRLTVAGKDGKGGIKLSLREIDPEIPIDQERPVSGQTVSTDGSEFIAVVQFWTRDEFYEMAMPSPGGDSSFMRYQFDSMLVVKADNHPYGEPPFYMASGQHNEDETDPCLEYQPSLQGLYMLKPSYDRARALEAIIAERIALARLFLKKDKSDLADGLGDEEGKSQLPRENAESATVLPAGYDLAKIEFEINQAFVELRKLQGEELRNAAPPSGQADIGATTQPWTARIAQAQEAIYPKLVLDDVRRAIRQAGIAVLRVFSKPPEEGGPPGPVYVFAKSKNGKIDPSRVIKLEPKDIPSLWLDVDISATSAQERATMEQLGIEILQTGLFSRNRIREEYFSDDDSDQSEMEVLAQQAADLVIPSVVKQEIAATYGSRIIIGNDGNAIGPNGQTLTPEQALQAKGYQQVPGAGQPGANGAGASSPGPGAPNALPQVTPGGMPPLIAPGTTPIVGGAG